MPVLKPEQVREALETVEALVQQLDAEGLPHETVVDPLSRVGDVLHAVAAVLPQDARSTATKAQNQQDAQGGDDV